MLSLRRFILRLLMAMPAVLCGKKHLGINELAGISAHQRREEMGIEITPKRFNPNASGASFSLHDLPTSLRNSIVSLQTCRSPFPVPMNIEPRMHHAQIRPADQQRKKNR
jgi:hypothetical protein